MNFADRVKDTTATTGTGTITLTDVAPTGYQTFAAAFATGTTLIGYYIVDTSSGAWEGGLGTLVTGTTLARIKVLSSSNSGSLVSFGAGIKDVFCALAARTMAALAAPATGRTYNTAGQLTGYTKGGITYALAYTTVLGLSVLSTKSGGGLTWTYSYDGTTGQLTGEAIS